TPSTTRSPWAESSSSPWAPTPGPGCEPAKPPVEISRGRQATGIDDQTFEDPATGAPRETAFTYPRNMAEGPGTDLYLSVTGSNALPPSPYGS
ncbi:MAG: hypothetical protein ACRDOE_15080, partial [Streptosporangiaceae bacterium]